MEEIFKNLLTQAPILAGVAFGVWLVLKISERYQKALDNLTAAMATYTAAVSEMADAFRALKDEIIKNNHGGSTPRRRD